MYEVIGTPTTRAFRVLWALEELGQPYESVPDAPRSEAVTALNPSGKVPVLRVDGEVITDSTAILTYLADKHGGLTFPAGSLERAKQDALTHCVLDEFDAVLWTAARHSFILPKEKRMPEVKDSLKWEYDRNLARMMDRLEGPYLMGETFTIADIILAHCGSWARAAGFPTDNDRFRDYMRSCRARPAYQTLTAKG